MRSVRRVWRLVGGRGDFYAHVCIDFQKVGGAVGSMSEKHFVGDRFHFSVVGDGWSRTPLMLWGHQVRGLYKAGVFVSLYMGGVRSVCTPVVESLVGVTVSVSPFGKP